MEENESSKGRYKTYSAEFKIAKIEEFMKSEKSEAAFCRDEGICLSTFRSWRSKSGLVKAETTVENKNNLTLQIFRIPLSSSVTHLLPSLRFPLRRQLLSFLFPQGGEES